MAPSTKKKRGQTFDLYRNPLPVLTYINARSSLTNPECVGILDVLSRSVWIVNSRDTDLLWQRGFFGKGSLSRSEPSWLTRRVNEAISATSGEYATVHMSFKIFNLLITQVLLPRT